MLTKLLIRKPPYEDIDCPKIWYVHQCLQKVALIRSKKITECRQILKMVASFLYLLLVAGMSYAWVPEMEKGGNYQGDIILNPEQMVEAKKGNLTFGSVKTRLWPKNIYVEFSQGIWNSKKAQDAIFAAIADYRKYTCLEFYWRNGQETYMYFYEGSGCSAYVGRWHGKNSISLSSGCWSKSTVIHEIGHSLGTWRELFGIIYIL